MISDLIHDHSGSEGEGHADETRLKSPREEREERREGDCPMGVREKTVEKGRKEERNKERYTTERNCEKRRPIGVIAKRENQCEEERERGEDETSAQERVVR